MTRNGSVTGPRRVDLHCHSRASTEADEALLLALQCPESYSEPREVYAQAKRRGMDFVTITDHDSINGVSELSGADIIVGEELTCYFPEDRCKMHVLVWGITPADHAALQAVASDIYRVADYLADRNLAHAVAHPLYRQNGKLDRWHMERLLLLFKGFECLNGAHSILHGQTITQVLDGLDEGEIQRLQRAHGLAARWPKPWIKTRTGGSDDHGLFNIGRTWTQFDAQVKSVEEVLECLKRGECGCGGEAGSSIKLAHNFYGVGMRYYSRQVAPPKSMSATLARRIVGERSLASGPRQAMDAVKYYGQKLAGRIGQACGLNSPARGTRLFADLFMASMASRLGEHLPLRQALGSGEAPLEQHESIFQLISQITRDVTHGIAGSLDRSLGGGEVGAVFDAVATVLSQQALLLPYYFALFHQNQERHLLSRIGQRRPEGGNLRVGVFSDGGGGAAGAFIDQLSRLGRQRGVKLTVHTCCQLASGTGVRNFTPLLHRKFASAELEVVIPPVLEIMESADRSQFDVVVANTTGPMALCGWLVAKMLRVPLISALHEDQAAGIFARSGGDYRLTSAASAYNHWFHGSAARVMARSHAAARVAGEMGISHEAVLMLAPATSVPVGLPDGDGEDCWQELKVQEPLRVVVPSLALGREEVKLLAEAFKRVCAERNDVALVVGGQMEGWVRSLKEQTAGLPLYTVAADKRPFYELMAGADLLLHLCDLDLSGQVVIDAQALGLPVLVRSGTAAAEMMDDGLTGFALPKDAQSWSAAVLSLLGDEPRRQRMSRTGPQRVRRFCPDRMFDAWWGECGRLARLAVDAIDTDAGSAGSTTSRPQTEDHTAEVLSP